MGILFNILAYVFISIVMLMRLSKPQKNRFIKLFNFVFTTWCVFFSAYLIRDYEYILSHPLNVELNWKETVTNFFIGIYLLNNYLITKKQH